MPSQTVNSQPRRKFAVINGDDFGFSREVNRAIIQAHKQGVLTSASLMVTGEAVDEAVALAHAHPKLAVGLHLVLVCGQSALPPSQIPHLVDSNGCFPSSSLRAGLRYQDYPDYQVIFAVRNPRDPVVAVVQKIIEDFPNIDIQLVISDRTIGTNPKVNNLANAVAAADHNVLIIADSDIHVGADYLQRVIQPLRDPLVGVVTCLYRSLVQGWVSTFEALGTTTHFQASVLVARNLQGVKFAFGSTIVLQKAALEAIAAKPPIANYLADDFQLGNLPTQAGYKVVLSDYVVEHVLGTTALPHFIQRQIRWARCIRVSQPWGYLGLIFTHGTVTSLLFLIVTRGSILGWTGLCITWTVRLVMAWVLGEGLHDPVIKKFLWLVPLRDIADFILWCYGFVGNSINWRGQRLKLIKGGLLVPLSNDSSKIMSS